MDFWILSLPGKGRCKVVGEERGKGQSEEKMGEREHEQKEFQ